MLWHVGVRYGILVCLFAVDCPLFCLYLYVFRNIIYTNLGRPQYPLVPIAATACAIWTSVESIASVHFWSKCFYVLGLALVVSLSSLQRALTYIYRFLCSNAFRTPSRMRLGRKFSNAKLVGSLGIARWSRVPRMALCDSEQSERRSGGGTPLAHKGQRRFRPPMLCEDWEVSSRALQIGQTMPDQSLVTTTSLATLHFTLYALRFCAC